MKCIHILTDDNCFVLILSSSVRKENLTLLNISQLLFLSSAHIKRSLLVDPISYCQALRGFAQFCWQFNSQEAKRGLFSPFVEFEATVEKLLLLLL